MRVTIDPHTEGVLNDDAGSTVRRSVLPAGVRVLTEEMRGQRSVTLGFWIGVGSRDEAAHQHGSTHFLEHLLFKGTKTRSSLEIASAFDSVGGESNALTGKEHTCYYARVLDTDLPMAVEVLTDIVTSALLDPAEMEIERGVILEELAMAEDDPEDVVHERFGSQVLDGHPLGRPIGGTPEEINAASREDVFNHYQRWYRPDELVITAAGGLDHDHVVSLIAEALDKSSWDMTVPGSPAERRVGRETEIPVRAGTETIIKPVEQSQVILGGRGMAASDDDRFALSVMHAVLGGGMSSRLFQEVRERRGLAYSTYSFSSAMTDAGYFGLYAGCLPNKVGKVTQVMAAELDRIATEHVSGEELTRAKGQLRGGTVLGMEETSSRMSRLGRAELVRGEFVDISDTLHQIDAITVEDVRKVAARLASSPRAVTVVGPA
ncbi:M16 family metallopeptidase [Nesterenkonia sandarakina]|uniref:Putative Zn-dependent peptidase n=1 Tax=Nesterenkonia sandarakina TaxID=272918 RepID=A0A2T0YK54_9MICC|nr:pitrilysin family protein [Nesterenkonia sandarakina]PRZ15581.1 putative Zn-dependent peptidase [Nesterenkonia sandarakina]